MSGPVNQVRKIFILVNPKAGSRKIRKLSRDLMGFLSAHHLDHQVFETTFESRGTELVRKKLDATFTDLAIIGGDGTINEAINGLKYDVPVSFIPAGSGDDFVKVVNIGDNPKEHFQTLVDGRIEKIDVGICNNRKFLNGIGVGFDGQIAADMQHRNVPFLSGQAKYYYHVLQILSSYRSRHFQLTVDGEKKAKDLILLTVANGTTFGGGFKLTPDADIADGEFDVCAVGKISALKRYLNILRLQKGTHGVLREVDHFRTKSISIGENELLEGHIDGEYMGHPPFDIKILPKSLSIRVRTS